MSFSIEYAANDAAHYRLTVAGNDFSSAVRMAVCAASTSAVSRVFSAER